MLSLILLLLMLLLLLLLVVMMMMDSEEGNDDIKYNFLIDQSGVIYEGRGCGVVGQHTKGKDSRSIGCIFYIFFEYIHI